MQLFIYGTLKRGQQRADMLDGQRYLGDVRSCPLYRMYQVEAYPGLVHDEGGVLLEGELWEVDQECLAELDQVERVDAGLYRRELITLEDPWQGAVVEAYFYLHPVDGLEDCGRCWEGEANRD